ncbi:hypothetical protein C5Y97_23540 [Blastopirellula marina]|uniref:PEP-CTERM protein-sorting domain-containing protein n=2 Tax=Blastopirellula marina TaxID=124 RepID=A0A2S8F9Y5_9BACT|nr:hypothetical protein C5Y98_23525 [Blastopirellula marina]PTL42027.1 hypothetical protein C5Y97_23540 [Blastopirellula marina]
MLGSVNMAEAAYVVASDNFDDPSYGFDGWDYQHAGTPDTGAMSVNQNGTMYATNDLSAGPITTDLYFSFTMTVGADTVLDPNMLVQFYFDSDPTNDPGSTMPWTFAPSVGLKSDQGGAGTSDFQARFAYSDQQYSSAEQATVGGTVGIIAKLSKSGGSAYDTLDLWVTDGTDTMPDFSSLGTPDATSFSAASTLESVATIGVFSVNLSGDDNFLLDNVVLATVPEPMTMALWGMGGIAGLAYSARRRKLANRNSETA